MKILRPDPAHYPAALLLGENVHGDNIGTKAHRGKGT